MPDISSTQSAAALKQIEENTHNQAPWAERVLNELRRLRIGDTSPEDKDVLK